MIFAVRDNCSVYNDAVIMVITIIPAVIRIKNGIMILIIQIMIFAVLLLPA